MICLAKKTEKEEKPKAEEKSHKAEKAKESHKAEEKAKEEKKEHKAEEKHKAEKKEHKAEKEEAKEEKAGYKEEKEEAKEEKHEHKEEKEGYKEEKEEAKEEKHEHKEEKAGYKEEKLQHKEKPKKAKHAKKEFVELKPAEINEAIVHLANEGHSASEIGMILRDQYGIPKIGKVVGKKLWEILKENKLAPAIPEDLMSLIRKSVVRRGHMERNKKDMSAKRGLMLTVSKIRALEKYYKKKGKLPMKWRYSPETAALLAK